MNDLTEFFRALDNSAMAPLKKDEPFLHRDDVRAVIEELLRRNKDTQLGATAE
jgi:hypothetical protein